MNIITAIKYGFEVLKIGKSLRNVAAWKNADTVASLLTAVAALAFALGMDLGLKDDVIAALGVAVASLVHAYLTWATSKKVGLGDRRGKNVEQDNATYDVANSYDIGVVQSPPKYRESDGDVFTQESVPTNSSGDKESLPFGTIGDIRARYDERVPDSRPSPSIDRRAQWCNTGNGPDDDQNQASLEPNRKDEHNTGVESSGWNDR